MTLAIIGSAVLGLVVLTVVLSLLAGAIRLSGSDEERLARAARRHHARDRRRSLSTSRPRTGWAAHPDAS